MLAVVAHPDDAELLCAGTLARARDDGAAIAVCVMCRGDKGQPPRPIPNLPGVRRKEVAAPATASLTERVSGFTLLLCSALAMAESKVLATNRADLRGTTFNTACACKAGKP